MRHLFGMSGGLSYHFAALRYRRMWRPFLKRVDQWLASWVTPEKELIIFGASGGWTIPANFLARFNRVIIVEPDPSARAILRRRFPRVRDWVMHDDTELLPWFQSAPIQTAPSPQTLKQSKTKTQSRPDPQSEQTLAAPSSDRSSRELVAFLAKYPDAAILFSNLLGQVPLVWTRDLTPTEWESCNASFLESLNARNWASYHDLLSGNCVPSIPLGEMPIWQKNESLTEVGARIWSDPKKNAVISDHGMDWLGVCELGLWHIRPRTYHLIGFITSHS